MSEYTAFMGGQQTHCRLNEEALGESCTVDNFDMLGMVEGLRTHHGKREM